MRGYGFFKSAKVTAFCYHAACKNVFCVCGNIRKRRQDGSHNIYFTREYRIISQQSRIIVHSLYSLLLMISAGTPTAVTPSGRSRMTTVPAPMTDHAPTVLP